MIAWHNDTPFRFPLMPKAVLSSLHRMLNEGNSKKWFFNHANSKNCISRMWKLKLYPRGKEEGGLAVYMTGVWSYDRASYCEPKNYFSLKLYTPKNNWHQNLRLPTKLRVKYLNTDLFIQTDFSHAWFCINKVMKLVCPLMSLRPPLCSTFTHSHVNEKSANE